MPATEVQQFIDALEQLESSRQHDRMVSLFAENCKVGNVISPDHFEGQEGASRFWQAYIGSFGEIRSDFFNRVESANQAALEWVAKGATAQGHSVSYQGITVLDFQGGKITRFMSYFDPHSLGRQFDGSADATRQEGNMSGNSANANSTPGGGSAGGGNAAPPNPEKVDTPDTTPANAGIRFEDERTSSGGDGAVTSDR